MCLCGSPLEQEQALCSACQGAAALPSEPRAAKVKLRKKIKKASTKQERQIMKGIGGRVQPASGAMASHKSDGRLRDKVRMEAKFTYADSYRVTLKDLNKLRSECQGSERPAFVIDFIDKSTGLRNDRWVLVTHSDWEKLVNGSTADGE